MSLQSSSRVARVALTAVLVTFAPAAAQAQIGGLIRKAKQAVEKATDSTAAQNPGGEELTQETVTSLLKGLRAASVKATERDALRAEQEQKQARLTALLDQHDTEEQRFQLNSEKVRECQDDFLSKAEEGRSDKMDAAGMSLMADPAKAQQYVQLQANYSQQLQAAQAKGDTAAVNQLSQKRTDALMKLMGLDLHADTAAAVKTCGAMPTKPSWMVEEESLRADLDKMGNQVRNAERDMELTGVEQSGMKAARYAALRERVLMWMQAMDDGKKPNGYSNDEQKLLESHRSDFKAVRNAL